MSCSSLLQGRRFLCREWALEKLRHCVDTQTAGVLLTGGPGAGKTALCTEALWPTSQAGRQAGLASRCLAAHFCLQEDDRTRVPWRFVLGLVDQLQKSLDLPASYRAALKDPAVALTLEPEHCQRDPDDTFKRAVLLPLLDIPVPPQNLFLLVDSLDSGLASNVEALGKDGGSRSITELLSTHLQLFPHWLLLICSTRHKDKTTCKMFPGFRKVALDDVRKPVVVRDVQQYILRRLEQDVALRRHLTPHTADMLNLLHIKSTGCFLFMERVLDGVVEGQLVMRQIRDIPGTLNGLYLWLCQRLFPKRLFSHVQPLLSVFLASRRPLTSEQLYVAVWTRDTALSWTRFKRQLESLSLFLVDGPGNTKVLFHSSFAQWLTDIKHCTQTFLCDVAEGHCMLAMSLTLRGPHLTVEESCHLAFHLVWSCVHLDQPHLLALWMLWSDVPSVLSGGSHSQWQLQPPFPVPTEVLQLLVKAGVFSPSCLPDPGCAERGTLQQVLDSPDSVHVLLDSGMNINERDSDGCTLMAKAAHAGSADVVELLLSRGADPEFGDSQGQTPIILAAQQGCIEVLEALLRWAGQRGAEGQRMVNHTDAEGWTALRSAAWAGHAQTVRLLLDAGADVDGCDSEGRTALRAAAWGGHKEIILTLLEKGAQVDQADREGRTPLIAAVYMGHLEATEVLLDAGAEVDRPDGDGRTALCVAAMWQPSAIGGKFTEVVSLLLEHGADPRHRAWDGTTPLLLAAYEGHTEVMELLLEAGADVDEAAGARASGAVTPLLAAASMGHVAVVNTALFWGADVDAIDAEGRTALCLAATRGSTDVVRTLLDRGLDENHKDDLGWTPLHAAACGGHRAVCAILTDHGSMARVAELDNEGRTALILAAQEGHCSTVRLLLDRRSPIDQRGYDGHSALSAAAQEGHVEVVELLMRRGADTDVRDAEGRPLLYLLMLEGRFDIATLLVKKGGVPLESRDAEGRTALHVASWRGDLEGMALLLQHGTDPNAQDKEGRPPLHSVAWRGHTAAARLLLDSKGILVDLACRQQGATALCIAAQEAHIGVVSVLLEKGADPEHVDKYGRSPMKVAEKRGHVNIIRLLESYGAKPCTGVLPSPPCTYSQTCTTKSQSSSSFRGTVESSGMFPQPATPSLSSCSPRSTSERFHSTQSSQTSSSTAHSLATMQTAPADSLSFTEQIQQHSLPRSRGRAAGLPSACPGPASSSYRPYPPLNDQSCAAEPYRLPKGGPTGWDIHTKHGKLSIEQGLEVEEKTHMFGGSRWGSVMVSLGMVPAQDTPNRTPKMRNSPILGYPIPLECHNQQEVSWKTGGSAVSPGIRFDMASSPGALPLESLPVFISTNPQINLKQAIKLKFEGPTSALVNKQETLL